MLCAVGLACALQGEVQAADGGPRDAATAPRVFDIAPGELAEVLLNICLLYTSCSSIQPASGG